MAMRRFVEGEKTNGRWAMMAVVGILGAEALGVPVKWYEAGAAQYDLPVVAQIPILFMTLGFLETKRYQGFKETGTVSSVQNMQNMLHRHCSEHGHQGCRCRLGLHEQLWQLKSNMPCSCHWQGQQQNPGD